MKPLPDQYKKNGYDFNRIDREGDVAIYEQIEPETNRRVAFEVFEVMKYPEREIGGVVVPAKEATPSNEMWGTFGYTVWNLGAANEKKDLLMAKIQERAKKREKTAKKDTSQEQLEGGFAGKDTAEG